MPEEVALRTTVHRQTDRRRPRLFAYLGSLLLIGFVLQLGYFVITRELFPLGAAPFFLYSVADLGENNTLWLELEGNGFPDLKLSTTSSQSTNSSQVNVEANIPNFIQGNGKLRRGSSLRVNTKDFTFFGPKALSMLHSVHKLSAARHRAFALKVKKVVNSRDLHLVTPPSQQVSYSERWNLRTSYPETRSQTETIVEEDGNQLNTDYEKNKGALVNVEESKWEPSNDAEETRREPKDDAKEFRSELSSNAEKLIPKLSKDADETRTKASNNSEEIIRKLSNNTEETRRRPGTDTVKSPQKHKGSVEEVPLRQSANDKEAGRQLEGLVDVHRRDWETVNNESFCREWRLERENWTAIVTERISVNRSTSCPNPYNHKSVKRILFRNFSEELIGCTRHTPQCPERATFSEKFNTRINVPPCCQRHLLEIYRHIETELTNLNVTHFMIGGGVIGWMRNKRMVPYDDDLDVLVPLNFWKTDDFWEFVWRMRHIHRMPCRLVEETKMKIYYSELNQINVDMWPYFFVHKKKKRRKCRTKKPNTLGRRRMTKKKSQSIIRHTSGKKKVLSRKMGSSKVKKRKMRTTDYGVGTMIDIPYKNFKLQPPSNLLPPKQVVFENFLVFMPNKPRAYLDRQYGVGKWEHELTCESVDCNNTYED